MNEIAFRLNTYFIVDRSKPIGSIIIGKERNILIHWLLATDPNLNFDLKIQGSLRKAREYIIEVIFVYTTCSRILQTPVFK